MSSPELQLTAEKIKFEALFKYASLGILVVNQKGEIILANTFLLSQFGYVHSKEIIGNKIEFLIPKRFQILFPFLLPQFFYLLNK
jgi:PAS domain S-box-containing protein